MIYECTKMQQNKDGHYSINYDKYSYFSLNTVSQNKNVPVWSVLQGRVYCTKISGVGKLKRRINSEWAALTHTLVDL